jgi:hypothetical protein
MCMDAKDQRRWRLCLLLAVLCSAYAITASTALADPLAADLAVGQSMIPGTPCAAPAPIMVLWRTGLTPTGGPEGVPGGKVVGQASGVYVDSDGTWLLVRCEITLDPEEYALMTACARRRLVMHEVIHLALVRHTRTGLMAETEDGWDQVAVPGCPALVVPLRERVMARVLDLVPTGWQVSCGPRRRLVLHCVADNGAVRGRPGVRRFRARLWDASGVGFTVVRIRSAR